MENLDIIILTSVVVVGFVVFIVGCFKEFDKMSKETYIPRTQNAKVYGRDALFVIVEKLLTDTDISVKEKKRIYKAMDRTIADMESDGVYFTEDVKEELKKQSEELFCEYSGLPSPKSYNLNQI